MLSISIQTFANRTEEARVRCAYAKQAEESQRYEDAEEALGSFWAGVGERPTVEGLERDCAAEVLLRAGALSGHIGSKRQIPNSQERAKDLISEAGRLFEELKAQDRLAESYIELGICYLREGALNEARLYLFNAQSKLENQGGDARARALLMSAIVEKDAAREQLALRYHLEAAPLVNNSKNLNLKARYHNEYAIVLRRLGQGERGSDYTDLALIEYSIASKYAELAGNLLQSAICENNIAMVLLDLGNFDEAHGHLDSCEKLLRRLNNKHFLGMLGESRARVFMADGHDVSAEKAARAGVLLLEDGGESVVLAEGLTTHGKALARIQRTAEAITQIERAVETAAHVGDAEGAGRALLVLLEEISSLDFETQRDYYFKADDYLKNTQDLTSIKRLKECGGRLLLMSKGNIFAGLTLKEARRELEKQLVREAMTTAGGNVSVAARFLGISPQGLHDKLGLYPDLKELQGRIHHRKPTAEIIPISPSLRKRLIERDGETERITVIKMPDDRFADRGVFEGDRIVTTSVIEPEDGSPVAVRFDGKIYVGYFYREGKGFRLESKTSGYLEWVFNPKDKVEHLGVIVKKIRASEIHRPKYPIHPF